MPAVKKQPHDRGTHFIQAWRKVRGISQEAAAEAIGLSRPNLSKIERGEVPYEQDHLEKLSALYGVTVGALIEQDPNKDPEISLFDLGLGDRVTFDEGERAQLNNFAKSLIRARPASELADKQVTAVRRRSSG